MREVINITKEDAGYSELKKMIEKVNEDNLIIVAKSKKNKKSTIVPVLSMNEIYFYVAKEVDGGLVYKLSYTDEELNIAKKNTINRARICGMYSIPFSDGSTLEDWIPSEFGMNFLTSNSKMNGAGILLCTDYLVKIKEKIGPYYILPSSIHEVIIVPKNILNPSIRIDMLTQIVKEININVVDDNDHLADNAFEYLDWI